MSSQTTIQRWFRASREAPPRDPRMAEVWAQPLTDWLVEHQYVGGQSRVLDFGCGYFTAGALLAPYVGAIDGYDINRNALVEASALYPLTAKSASLFTERNAIPRRTYDVILVSSVLQYLPHLEAVEETLRFLAECLAPREGALIVVADVIPPSYSAAMDALENLVAATRAGVLVPMIRHLARCVLTGSEPALLRLSPDALSKAAGAAGLKASRLDRNLTPSRRRLSFLLKPERAHG